MASVFDRRAWLIGSVAALAASRVPRGSTAEPPVRPEGSHFKFSLAAYKNRALLQGSDARMTLADFVADCAAFELEGTELTSYYFPDPVTDEYLRDLRRTCFRLGLDVSGTAVRNDFGLPPGAERDRWIAHVKAWVDHSVLLGAPVIRVFAGDVPKGSSPEEAHRRIVEAFEECCDYAGSRGVHLAVENHGGPTATADGLLAIVNDVKSVWFGVNLDTGNFRSDDVYGDLAKTAPHAINVQVKVTVADRSGKSQPMDFGRIAAILRDVGYRGYVVLEYEEGGDPRQESRRHLDALRAAFLA